MSRSNWLTLKRSFWNGRFSPDRRGSSVRALTKPIHLCPRGRWRSANRTDANEDDPIPPARQSRTENGRFSRDLVDAYFRQIGEAKPLSRAEEVALAKHIEAAQRAVLRGLCRVPMIVERIAGWADELSEGRRRLTDLVDLSMLDDALVAEGGEERSDDPPSAPKPACEREARRCGPRYWKRSTRYLTTAARRLLQAREQNLRPPLLRAFSSLPGLLPRSAG